jgi:hypothetical protein
MLRVSYFKVLRDHLADVAAGELAVAAKVQIPVGTMPLAGGALSAASLATLHHL